MNEWIENYRNFRTQLDLIVKYLVEAFKVELRRQGHFNKGTLESSFTTVLKYDLGNVVYEIYSEHYGRALERGVPATSIKYTPNSGKAKSAYIDGLHGWVTSKLNLTGRDAWGATFSIAKTQKREGMPTRGSLLGGDRLNWISNTISKESGYIDRMVDDAATNFINTIFTKIMDDTQKQLK